MLSILENVMWTLKWDNKKLSILSLRYIFKMCTCKKYKMKKYRKLYIISSTTMLVFWCSNKNKNMWTFIYYTYLLDTFNFYSALLVVSYYYLLQVCVWFIFYNQILLSRGGKGGVVIWTQKNIRVIRTPIENFCMQV